MLVRRLKVVAIEFGQRREISYALRDLEYRRKYVIASGIGKTGVSFFFVIDELLQQPLRCGRCHDLKMMIVRNTGRPSAIELGKAHGEIERLKTDDFGMPGFLATAENDCR
jgi:hypothetical protein